MRCGSPASGLPISLQAGTASPANPHPAGLDGSRRLRTVAPAGRHQNHHHRPAEPPVAEPFGPTHVCGRSPTCATSECQFQPELNDPGITSRGIRPGYAAEASRTDLCDRIIKIRLVENVEELRAELRLKALVHPKVLEQPHVPAIKLGPVQGVSSKRPEGPDIVDGKCRRIEPHTLIRTRRRSNAGAGQLRPIIAQAGE